MNSNHNHTELENNLLIQTNSSKSHNSKKFTFVKSKEIKKEEDFSCGTLTDFIQLPINEERACCWFCFRVITTKTAFKDNNIENKVKLLL